MNHALHQSSPQFEALVEHIGAFGEKRRERFAELYAAETAKPVDIALQWCRHPDEFADVVEAQLGDTEARWVLEQLVQEHDMAVDIGWVDQEVRDELVELGLIRPPSRRRKERNLAIVPGAIAAMLAGRISGTRPTLPMLLGRACDDEVVALAEQYGISTEGSTVETILRMSDIFATPDFLDIVLSRLPNPDWIGGAMMTLELGGICYWREIFGHDLDEGPDEDNVVPLMRSDERDEQREIADLLLEMGVLFKIEGDEAEHALVALPEELWFGLWTLGQSWMLDWTSLAFTELEAAAVRQQHHGLDWDLQSVFKWLFCEAERDQLAGDHAPTAETIASLEARTEGVEIDWDSVFAIGRDMGIIEPDRLGYRQPPKGLLVKGGFGDFLVGMPRPRFVRECVSSWMLGRVGTLVDRHMPQAVGLDEQWRQRLNDIFSEHTGKEIAWWQYEGVGHVETGAGCLREIDEDDEELVMLELELVNTCLTLAKMHWLDLLSVLEADEWYSMGQLAELLQWSASFALFSQLGHIVHDPAVNFYFPLQRPSFLSFPMHADAFAEWCEDIVRHLLVPLDVAEVSDDGHRVWLDTGRLRVPLPKDWPEEPRLNFMREVLGEPDFEVDVPEINSTALHSVPQMADDDAVDLSQPADAVLEACKGREITSFDGKALRLQ